MCALRRCPQLFSTYVFGKIRSKLAIIVRIYDLKKKEKKEAAYVHLVLFTNKNRLNVVGVWVGEME